jgi:TRAP-type C4-dicarboxylate transport system permease small subunit
MNMQILVKVLSLGSALVGGVVLLGLIGLNTLSIIGRGLSKLGHALVGGDWMPVLGNTLVVSGIDEIKGTYELTESGVAFAIFSFLSVCQFYGAHATVDVFTSRLPRSTLAWVRAFWEIILSITILFITLRLYDGMQRYLGNGETTLFLQFPVWWSYGACVIAASIASITAVYCASARIIEASTGNSILPEG